MKGRFRTVGKVVVLILLFAGFLAVMGNSIDILMWLLGPSKAHEFYRAKVDAIGLINRADIDHIRKLKNSSISRSEFQKEGVRLFEAGRAVMVPKGEPVKFEWALPLIDEFFKGSIPGGEDKWGISKQYWFLKAQFY